MNTLYAKLAALLAAAFVAIAGLLVVITQAMFEAERVVELTTDVVIAGAVFALLAALAVFHLFTRRLKRLTDAVEAFQRSAFTQPARVPGADARGDEIERLSAHFERMSERMAGQLRELEGAAERRRELLANVSHDLRTPLASMQGYLELLLLRHGGLPPAEERNYLETAARHCERLGRLVGELVELTKLEAHELQPRPEDFPLAELVQDVAQKFALDAQRRQVQLQADCARAGSSAATAHADIGMVERVLENLVENALRHTPAGGRVTLEVAAGATLRPTVAVQDSGQGIAAADLANIFERYYRAERTAQDGHAGLGLAIARRMVQLHGGELTVRSRPGEGTRFEFDLPGTAAALAAPEPGGGVTA